MAFNPLERKGNPVRAAGQELGRAERRALRQERGAPVHAGADHPDERHRGGGGAVRTPVGAPHGRHASSSRSSPWPGGSSSSSRRRSTGSSRRTNPTLEVTIGYEQVAVDLTAWLAQTEPDPYVKAALDFALLEDFDHLYRYANLMSDRGRQRPGRDGRRADGDHPGPARPSSSIATRSTRSAITTTRNRADILTKLHVLTIVAGEQQTMNFYMNVGNRPRSRSAGASTWRSPRSRSSTSPTTSRWPTRATPGSRGSSCTSTTSAGSTTRSCRRRRTSASGILWQNLWMVRSSICIWRRNCSTSTKAGMRRACCRRNSRS